MDQYLNFISLEDDMFVLRDQNSHEISYYSELHLQEINERKEVQVIVVQC